MGSAPFHTPIKDAPQIICHTWEISFTAVIVLDSVTYLGYNGVKDR